MGAVTPVPMFPTYQTLDLAVREHMRLEGTNVMCAHISLRMVAFSFSTALCFQIYMHPEPRGSTSSCCTLHLTFPTMSHNVHWFTKLTAIADTIQEICPKRLHFCFICVLHGLFHVRIIVFSK